MTYYINPIWFYLMNASDCMHWLFLTFGIFLIFFGAVGLLCYMSDNDRECVSMLASLVVAGIVATFISAIIPSKETCIEMMIASQVTHENVSGTREEVYQIIDYVTEKMNGKESEK